MRDQIWNVPSNMKNELFIEKSYVKIDVGILFYRCKTKLAVESKSRRNMTIGSSHNRWGSILTVGSHPASIWTIRCIWNWPLELRPNLDHQINVGKLGAIRSIVGGDADFFKKLAKNQQNKSKYHRFFLQLAVVFLF